MAYVRSIFQSMHRDNSNTFSFTSCDQRRNQYLPLESNEVQKLATSSLSSSSSSLTTTTLSAEAETDVVAFIDADPNLSPSSSTSKARFFLRWNTRRNDPSHHPNTSWENTIRGNTDDTDDDNHNTKSHVVSSNNNNNNSSSSCCNSNNDSTISPSNSSSSSTTSASFRPQFEAAIRASRLLWTVGRIVLDYTVSSNHDEDENEAWSLSWKMLTTIYHDTKSNHGNINDSDRKIEPNNSASSAATSTRQYWIQELKKRQQILHETQTIYTTPTTNTEDDDLLHESPATIQERFQRRLQEKVAMQNAAEAVVQAEQKIRELSDNGTPTGSSCADTGSCMNDVHERAAERLLALCRTNLGVYIKIGQHLANLDYILPAPYITALSSLFDDTPTSDYQRDVRMVIQQDLGADPTTLFHNFDPQPIASASLAQVHVAYDKQTGQKLAVKVQHRGLRETSVGDINALVTAVKLVERWFPKFSLGWIADEIAPQLPRELNFINEGKNAEAAAAALKEAGLACVVPKIIWEYTSPRVLTMEYVEGFKVTDTDAIATAGLRRRDVAYLVASVFSSQVFLSTFGVHCDPHPANVLVRPSKTNPTRPEIVLLDHGLYRHLDREFQLQYCYLWQSMMLADIDGIRHACQRLGVEKAYTLFAALLTGRPFDEIVERSQSGNQLLCPNYGNRKSMKDIDQVVIRAYVQRFLSSILELIGKLPRPMLLLLKMK
jgi:aarF domain-containing kinase